MNTAMAKLAEKLGIDHAKLPREDMAEIVCEKALETLDKKTLDLSDLKEFLHRGKARALEKRKLFIAHRIETALTFICCFERRKAIEILAKEKEA